LSWTGGAGSYASPHGYPVSGSLKNSSNLIPEVLNPNALIVLRPTTSNSGRDSIYCQLVQEGDAYSSGHMSNKPTSRAVGPNLHSAYGCSSSTGGMGGPVLIVFQAFDH
jgi:hypothetical protein